MEDKTKNLVYAVEDDEGIQELYQGALGGKLRRAYFS